MAIIAGILNRSSCMDGMSGVMYQDGDGCDTIVARCVGVGWQRVTRKTMFAVGKSGPVAISR